MSTTKRASLPGADELFRSTTHVVEEQPAQPQPIPPAQSPSPNPPMDRSPSPRVERSSQRHIDKSTKLHAPTQGSGRTRHEEKVTFYCTREELLALERARIALREFGVSVDRGRIVREALSYALADLDASGAAAILLDRLNRRR